jgi:hypothetical protein
MFNRFQAWSGVAVAAGVLLAGVFAPVAVASTAGGVLGTWSRQSPPTGLDHLKLEGASCAVAVTANGGAVWAKASVPQARGYLTAVSCTRAARCLAVGQWYTPAHGAATDDGPFILTRAVGDGEDFYVLSHVKVFVITRRAAAVRPRRAGGGTCLPGWGATGRAGWR